MNFKECYEVVKTRFNQTDFSKVDTDFSGMIYLENTQEPSDSGYIYLAYIKGEKHIEPIKHDKANIVVTISTNTFESICNGKIGAFKAFSSGQIKAKGNIFLALSIYKKLKL